MEGVFDQTVSKRTSSAFGAVPKPTNRLNSFNQMSVPENHKPGIPPSHPNINIPPSNPHPQFMASQSYSGSQRLRSSNLSPVSSHSRSLSQPSFFSLDSLPPLSHSPYHDPTPVISFSASISTDVSMEESLVASDSPSPAVPVNRVHALLHGHSLPPRKGHRRSSSDSPLGASGFVQSFPQLVPPVAWSDGENSVCGGERSGFEKLIQLARSSVNKDWEHVDGYSMSGRKEYSVDDLFDACLNLDNISGGDDKDFDSRTTGSKTVESSDNEVESHAIGKRTGVQEASSNCSEERREGIKRSSGGDIAPGARHRRSFSWDSSIGNFHVELPALQNPVGQHSPYNSIDDKTSETSMEFGNGEFSSEELKKIMEDEKLAEIALTDPKRVKRILAIRQSAARSKERKMRYISELETKVQTLQIESTTLAAQFTKLQMENSELKSQNKEYKLRLQAIEQQSQLKNALSETLDAEVRYLRRTVAELGGETILSSCMARQLSINQQMFQLQHQQPSHRQKETET